MKMTTEIAAPDYMYASTQGNLALRPEPSLVAEGVTVTVEKTIITDSLPGSEQHVSEARSLVLLTYFQVYLPTNIVFRDTFADPKLSNKNT